MSRGERLLRWAAPALLGLAVLALWEALVRLYAVPPYILPGPVAIGQALVADWPLLSASLLVTLKVAALALLAENSAAAAAAIRLLSDDDLDRAVPVSLYGDAELTCQFMLEDHAVRHSIHHLSRLRAAVQQRRESRDAVTR